MKKYSILDKNFSVEDLRKLEENRLEKLAGEIRDHIINVTQKNGGHIAPSLGVVDLTIVLHYLYNTPEDKIIWDVGHQAYAHKIITNRAKEFETLREYGGISGFLKSKESKFDVYEAGHTSTSISAAAGFAISRKLSNKKNKIISIIGDGALTGGVAFEGLNLIGSLKEDVLIILNDNEMSIAPNVGGFSKYFNKMITNKIYLKTKKEVQKIMKNLKMGDNLIDFVERIEESLKNIVIKGAFFEDLGFEYFGPVDGHDINEMIDIINKIKNIDGPKLLHIYTQKGKGFEKAEKDPENFHGISPKKDKSENKNKKITKYTDVFSSEVYKIAKKDKEVVAITAAMPNGTGLKVIRENIPERYIDAGIAEQSAVITANALAKEGYKPFVAIYSTFLQRAFDQMIHDVALQNNPVKFFLDRAGVVGRDGPTHHGCFDISYLRLIPNIVSLAPKDSREMRAMINFMHKYSDGPITIRYPRGEAVKPFGEDKNYKKIKMGEGEILKEGEDVVFFALGRMVKEAYSVSEMLEEDGISAGVFNLRFIKPLDREKIIKLARSSRFIVTLEYGNMPGGVGEGINSILAENGISKKILNIGIPDEFVEHGQQQKLFKILGLDSESIYKRVKTWMND
ncbi:MAG: 1-deoxy-D-xylulose-5-phosphate synthase [Candidatus Mcinerneyibacterium aminivorans]|uniref:1-deoxy-D-xylulose-5-phosphate synthase n=1 Tax=Candidatus Mcinerneyibacterium aminivorans TaxID=2703815 RepID=A0A5D0MGU5_9BACT|nr:MAG: 1-deoxy-D-xylulose-5-phosphate synthase [Candidatus Mcinerneyibacterium aminivorans]